MRNFDLLVERALTSENRTHMRPVIEKELLHYDILFALDNAGLLDNLTFQGGTALRLCYGAARYSEDLDFAGGKAFVATHLTEMKSCLEKYLGNRYGLTVTVKEPKQLSEAKKMDVIRVDKWQLNVITTPEKKDLPQQKIKIEVINIPAYSREPRVLQRNYDFLPDGYSDTLIMTESLDEIMADKLIAFVACTRYIRYRDIWDLRWLKQQGAVVQKNYILNKIQDYRISDYFKKLNDVFAKLDDIVKSKIFYDEMTRFIPIDAQQRTLHKKNFSIFLSNEMKSLFEAVRKLQHKTVEK